MRSRGFKIALGLLYALGVGLIVFVAWKGFSYYTLPLVERPRSEGHMLFKPGGLYGNSLGILGSLMLMLLFLYSARKRRVLGLRQGKLARWLDIHIWFGIMGPCMITLHSAFKFKGIVSISYFSMMAVMLSGFLGRYIYGQIPRDEKGTALPTQEIEEEIVRLGHSLSQSGKLSVNDLALMDSEMTRLHEKADGSGNLLRVLWADLLRPIRAMRMKGELRRRHSNLSKRDIAQIVRLETRRALLTRRQATLSMMNRIFHYWHVIHKPFAYVMVIIMVAHIAVVFSMGYGWPF